MSARARVCLASARTHARSFIHLVTQRGRERRLGRSGRSPSLRLSHSLGFIRLAFFLIFHRHELQRAASLHKSRATASTEDARNSVRVARLSEAGHRAQECAVKRHAGDRHVYAPPTTHTDRIATNVTPARGRDSAITPGRRATAGGDRDDGAQPRNQLDRPRMDHVCPAEPLRTGKETNSA